MKSGGGVARMGLPSAALKHQLSHVATGLFRRLAVSTGSLYAMRIRHRKSMSSSSRAHVHGLGIAPIPDAPPDP
jgi:hypothetical protein